MVQQEEGKWVVPNPQVPRAFGILNIVFGVLLILFSSLSIVMWFVGPMIQNAVMTSLKDQQATKKADRDARIAALKKKEDAAKTKEEKESIAEERTAVETDVQPDLTGFMGKAMGLSTDKRMVVYTVVEGIAGIILNVLLVVSGVGLLRTSEWARRLALGVAWLKILRWVGIIVFTMVVVVPITTEMQREMFQEIEKTAKAKGGGPMIPMSSFAEATAIGTAVWAVMVGMFAMTYPAISLWFLTRPATRAACLARAKPAGQLPELEPGARS